MQHRKASAPTIPAVRDLDLEEFERRLAEEERYERIMRLGELLGLHDAVAESRRLREQQAQESK